MEFLFLLIGLLLGYTLAVLIAKSKKSDTAGEGGVDENSIRLEKENAILTTNLAHSNKERDEALAEIVTRDKEFAALQEDVNEKTIRIERSIEKFKAQDEKYEVLKEELEKVHKKYSTEFENIANKILDDKSKKFTDQNKTNLDIILNPLKERISDFEEKVEKAYKVESDERVTLKTEIKHLIDLNKQVSEEANNLAKALKGENKTQGNWGELILEKVLERSGLIQDQEYKLQFSTHNDEGKRIQPDVVIMLPEEKHIIIDSKVSLVAYEALVNVNSDEEREQYLKDHLLSVKTHIKQLSDKNYQSSSDFNTPEFVLLFIPIESSFSVAVQADQELFNFAWDKKIVIVSPSTLLATLRTISSIWKQERQTKNAIEIAKQSGALYDKFVGFIEDLDKIGKNIDASKNAYDGAINKLHKGTGNLVKRVQNIEKLGAKTSKKIPSKFIEDSDEAPQISE